MSNKLIPGEVVNAVKLNMDLELLPPGQVISGFPSTGFMELGNIAGTEIGIWEHSVGVSTDVESDEVFIVISGEAIIAFLDGDRAEIEVKPGSMVRLAAGMRTRWSVTDTLRKVYLAPAE